MTYSRGKLRFNNVNRNVNSFAADIVAYSYNNAIVDTTTAVYILYNNQDYYWKTLFYNQSDGCDRILMIPKFPDFLWDVLENEVYHKPSWKSCNVY